MQAIAKTWHGERSLGETYWLWFILPGVVLTAAAFVTGLILGGIGNATALMVATVVFMGGQLAITYGIGPAVIRSALRSEAHIAWRWLAGAAAVIGMIWIPFGVYNSFMTTMKATSTPPVVESATLGGSDEASLTPYQTQFLAQTRQHLPQGEGQMRLTAAAFKGSTLVFGYSVDLWPDYEPDAIMFKNNRLNILCYEFGKIYREGELDTLSYRYFFKNGTEMSFLLTARECALGKRETPKVTGPGTFITDIEKDLGIDL